MKEFENLERIAKRSVNLETLVPQFEGKILAMLITRDQKTDSDVLMMKVELVEDDDVKQLTQKLKGMHIAELLDVNLPSMGITKMSQLVDHKFVFKKTTFRIGFPRWLPIKRVG